jgi:hypothetical protein
VPVVTWRLYPLPVVSSDFDRKLCHQCLREAAAPIDAAYWMLQWREEDPRSQCVTLAWRSLGNPGPAAKSPGLFPGTLCRTERWGPACRMAPETPGPGP